MTLTVHQLPADNLICRVIVSETEWDDLEAFHQTREVRHLGGRKYIPGTFVVRNEQKNIIDRFRIDCDGQCIETD